LSLKKSNVGFSKEQCQSSNKQARSTWEHKAVGSQRALGEKPRTHRYYSNIRDYRYGYETPFIPCFFDYLGMQGKRVLEIGVGNGIDAVEMMRNGACYTGIDITTNHLSLTRRYVELERKAGYEMCVEGIIEGDLMEVSLNGGYDVVYSFGVLHHITHEEDLLRRIKDLMSEQGELRIALYSSFSFFNIWMILLWLLRDRCRHTLDDWRSHLAEGSILGKPVVIKIRSRREIQKMLEQAGFEVVRYGRKGFVQGYLPLIGRYLNPDGWTLNTLAKLFGWYHCFICRPKG